MFARFATIGALSEQALGQWQTDLRSSGGGKRAAVLWLQQARTSSDRHASRRMHCGNKPRRRALAALMPSSALVHLGWVVRRLDRADGYITASSQEVCLQLFGRPTSVLVLNQPAFRRIPRRVRYAGRPATHSGRTCPCRPKPSAGAAALQEVDVRFWGRAGSCTQ